MFNSRNFKTRPGSILFENELRTVELGTAFRRVHCYNCDLTTIYKYRVQQIRRTDPAEGLEDGSLTDHQVQKLKTIPRYAEIPETVKCKRCGEVLGLYTECIY